jgi:hypothetical protein
MDFEVVNSVTEGSCGRTASVGRWAGRWRSCETVPNESFDPANELIRAGLARFAELEGLGKEGGQPLGAGLSAEYGGGRGPSIDDRSKEAIRLYSLENPPLFRSLNRLLREVEFSANGEVLPSRLRASIEAIAPFCVALAHSCTGSLDPEEREGAV